MSMDRFFKQNKIPAANAFIAATDSLLDEDGKPLLWEVRPLTTKEAEALRKEYLKDVPIPGRSGTYRQRIDTFLLTNAMLVKAVIHPDLNDAALQDSYGVKTPGELLREMLSAPGEYDHLVEFVQKISKMDITIEEEVDDAKN